MGSVVRGGDRVARATAWKPSSQHGEQKIRRLAFHGWYGRDKFDSLIISRAVIKFLSRELA